MKKILFSLIVTAVIFWIIAIMVKILGFENSMIAILALIIGENRATTYWKEK